MNSIAEYYSRFSEQYLRTDQSSYYWAKDSLESFFKGLPPICTLLDAGCGPGVEASAALRLGHNVIGLDFADGMMSLFRKNNPQAQSLLGDMRSIALLDHAVDAVLCSFSTLHMSDEELKDSLREFHRVLKPWGSLMFLTATMLERKTVSRTHKSAITLGLSPIGFEFRRGEELDGFISESGFGLVASQQIDIGDGMLMLLVNAVREPKFNSSLVRLGTSWRARNAKESELIAASSGNFAGISRFARIERLAGFSSPVYSASRPESKVAITVVGGKGVNSLESKLSAWFEGIEVAAAEQQIHSKSYRLADLQGAALPVLPPSSLASLDLADVFEWTLVRDYETHEYVWCPLAAVTMLPVERPFRPESNGLASGTDFYEAVLHGLLEILERHAQSIALVQRDVRSLDMATVNDPDSIALCDQAQQLGMSFEVKDISPAIGIPAYFAIVSDVDQSDSHLISGGLGCHIEPLIALRRALLEAVQSRAVAIAGGREDIESRPRLRDDRFRELLRIYSFWYQPTPQKTKLPATVVVNDLEEAIRLVLSSARRASPILGRFCIYTFPSPRGVSVVRCILEGAEIFSLVPDRLGPTLRPIFAQLS